MSELKEATYLQNANTIVQDIYNTKIYKTIKKYNEDVDVIVKKIAASQENLSPESMFGQFYPFVTKATGLYTKIITNTDTSNAELHLIQEKATQQLNAFLPFVRLCIKIGKQFQSLGLTETNEGEAKPVWKQKYQNDLSLMISLYIVHTRTTVD